MPARRRPVIILPQGGHNSATTLPSGHHVAPIVVEHPSGRLNCPAPVCTSVAHKMKRLREIIFNDSSSVEEDNKDEDLEMSMIMILNKDFRAPRRGCQFGCAWTNQNRAEGHDKIMRNYFNSDATYTDKQF